MMTEVRYSADLYFAPGGVRFSSISMVLVEAAEVSVRAVADYAREGETGVRLVRFVMFGADAEEAFSRAAEGFDE